MPKPRRAPRQAKEFFQVSPWQDKKAPIITEQQHNTAFAPLIAQHPPVQLAPPCLPPACRAPHPEAVTGQWMDRKAKGASIKLQKQMKHQKQQQLVEEEEDLTEEEQEVEQGLGVGRAADPDEHTEEGSSLQAGPLDVASSEEEEDWLQPAPSSAHQRGRKLVWLHRQRAGGGEGGEEEEDVREQQRLQELQRLQSHAPFRLRPSEAGLSGVCRLALLLGGHLSGHLLDVSTRRCYGVMGTRVAVGGGGCRHDEDVEFLCLSLLTFGTHQEAHAAVVKTGGDMARIEPAEEGDLVRFPELRLRLRLPACSAARSTASSVARCSEQGTDEESDHDLASTQAAAVAQAAGFNRRGGNVSGGTGPAPSWLAEEEGLVDTKQLLAMRVHFVPSVLYASSEADQQLAAFAPRLKGRGATVIVGNMRVDGLPQDFA